MKVATMLKADARLSVHISFVQRFKELSLSPKEANTN